MPVGISALFSGASILFIEVLTSSVLCALPKKLIKQNINVKSMLTWGGGNFFYILLHNVNFLIVYNFTSKRPFAIRIVSPQDWLLMVNSNVPEKIPFVKSYLEILNEPRLNEPTSEEENSQVLILFANRL